MRNIVKIGLVCMVLSSLLNADEKIKIENEHENSNTICKLSSNGMEINVFDKTDSLKGFSICKENKNSNISAITFISNIDGTNDVKIDLLSNEINSFTIKTLSEIIKKYQDTKQVNKVYIDIEKQQNNMQ